MEAFTVCYDKYCLGKFEIAFREDGSIEVSPQLGRFENYILNMWNDGIVVTMKQYDPGNRDVSFILLLPDGSEQHMKYEPDGTYAIRSWRKAGEGRMAYLISFGQGLEYKGFKGYDEFDEEEGMFLGVVQTGEETLTYCGRNVSETRQDFEQVIEDYLKSPARGKG